MSADGLKQAFCLLLWKSNGGQVDAKGRPIAPSVVTGQLTVITDEELEIDEEMATQTNTEQRYARGLCTKPVDCHTCQLMQAELQFYDPAEINWVCPTCTSDVMKAARARGVRLSMPGHFTEGVCMYRGCARPSRVETAEDLPGVPSDRKVELPPGYSRYLQLVLGPINT